MVAVPPATDACASVVGCLPLDRIPEGLVVAAAALVECFVKVF